MGQADFDNISESMVGHGLGNRRRMAEHVGRNLLTFRLRILNVK